MKMWCKSLKTALKSNWVIIVFEIIFIHEIDWTVIAKTFAIKALPTKKLAKNENQAVTYENRNISDCDYITLIKNQQKHNQINVTVQFLRFNGSELYHGTLITIYSKRLLCHVFNTNGNEHCPSSPRKRNV